MAHIGIENQDMLLLLMYSLLYLYCAFFLSANWRVYAIVFLIYICVISRGVARDSSIISNLARCRARQLDYIQSRIGKSEKSKMGYPTDFPDLCELSEKLCEHLFARSAKLLREDSEEILA